MYCILTQLHEGDELCWRVRARSDSEIICHCDHLKAPGAPGTSQTPRTPTTLDTPGVSSTPGSHNIYTWCAHSPGSGSVKKIVVIIINEMHGSQLDITTAMGWRAGGIIICMSIQCSLV